jgi:hypothetical protein
MSVRMDHVVMSAVLSLSMSLGAQPFARHAAGQQPTPAAPPESKTTTIVGCLVQGLPGSAGAKDGVEAATAQDYFIRTPTVKVPPGATVAVGTPGTTSTATSIGTPAGDSFYRVSGLSADQLKPHVGHRVTLQGQLSDNYPGIESTRATTTQDKDGRATTTVETRIAIAGVLRATTIKMVSANCQ